MHVNDKTGTSIAFATVNHKCAHFIGRIRLSHGSWHMITHANDPSLANSNPNGRALNYGCYGKFSYLYV